MGNWKKGTKGFTRSSVGKTPPSPQPTPPRHTTANEKKVAAVPQKTPTQPDPKTPLFHGSDRRIPIGATIDPRTGYAHATTELDCADTYGNIIHIVAPNGTMEHDVELDNPPGMDWRSTSPLIVIGYADPPDGDKKF